jgi:arginine:ornithine antiporter/lysine permease
MIYAGGMKFVLLSAILYAPGTILFVVARLEQKRQLFKPVEGLIFATIVAMALIGIFSLASGIITV